MALDLEIQEFSKYETFANVVSLIHVNDPSIFSREKSSNLKVSEDGPCEEAVAAYSLATIGLSACWATGPAAPIFCTAAIAGKALAFKMMIDACGEEETETETDTIN